MIPSQWPNCTTYSITVLLATHILMTSMRFSGFFLIVLVSALDAAVFALFDLFALFAKLTNPHSYKYLSGKF